MKSFLPAKADWSAATPRDVVAGLTVAVVALPLALGFGVASGLGAAAGLATAMAVARAGRYMRYVPAPVVEGFTLGIAAVIALQQIPAALGVPTPDGHNVVVNAVRAFGPGPALPAVALAGGVAVIMLVGARWKPAIPFSVNVRSGATSRLAALVHA